MTETFNFTEWESALGASDFLAEGILELKISNKLHKKKEEIEQHCVDESLDEVNRALHIVQNGQAVQMFSVLQNFNQLASKFPQRVVNDVFPAILTSASRTSNHLEFQTALCIFLVNLIEKTPPCFVPPSSLVLPIFEITRINVKNSNESLVQCWSNVYLACVSKGLAKDLLVDIIKIVMIEGGFTQPAACRIWCAKVLGACTHHFTSDEITALFLDKAMSLCQDTDMEVRACMGPQLSHFVQSVSVKVCHQRIMPEFLELVIDETAGVRQAAITGLSDCLDHLNDDTKRQLVVPTFMNLIRDANLHKPLSKEIGRFYWHCRSAMNDQKSQILVSFYMDLAQSQDQDIRINCMYNMPAMFSILGPDTRLISMVERFSTDTSLDVRLKVAACLPVIAKLLQNASFQLLRPTFFNLLNDDDEVFQQILKSLNSIFESFLADDSFRKGTEMNDCLFLLFRRLRDAIHKEKWYLLQKYLDQIRPVLLKFDPDQLYDVSVPVLMRIINDCKRPPLSELALIIIMDQVCRFRRLEQRDLICRTLVSEFAFSSSYRLRLLFLKVCDIALNCYSSKFFRQYFAHAFLSLSTESVIGVNRRMMGLLPLAIAAIMAVSIPLGCPLINGPGCTVIEPALDNTSTSSRSTSDDILMKKAILILDALKPFSKNLVLEFQAPPVKENAVNWDKNREILEEHVVREDVEDSRRRTDTARSAGVPSLLAPDTLIKDRKRVLNTAKPASKGTAKFNLSLSASTKTFTAPIPNRPIPCIGLTAPPPTPATAKQSLHQPSPPNLQKGHSSELEPTTLSTSPTLSPLLPRLKSANSALRTTSPEPNHALNSLLIPTTPQVRSVSNTTLASNNACPIQTGSASSLQKLHVPANQTKPPLLAEAKRSMDKPVSRQADSAKHANKGSVKLPLLSKSTFGK